MADNIGSLWVKNPQGVWVKDSQPYARIATGYKKAHSVYQKTGASTWTLRVFRDIVPPAPAVSLTLSINSSGQLVVTSKASADNDIVSMHWAWGQSDNNPTYPTTPPTTDTATTDIFACTPNQVITKSYGAQISNRTYYWVCWLKDKNGNFSSPKMVKFNTGTVPGASNNIVKSAYFWPTDSGSWDDIQDQWVTVNDYVYQGGNYMHGFWFYGSAIANALAKAKLIQTMKITIARVDNGSGATTANVWLSAHSLKAKITGNPNTYDSPGAKVGTLARGQWNTFDVPSGYWDNFRAQKWVGCGLFYGQTSTSDPNYLIAYGDNQGADNGRIYIEWVE